MPSRSTCSIRKTFTDYSPYLGVISTRYTTLELFNTSHLYLLTKFYLCHFWLRLSISIMDCKPIKLGSILVQSEHGLSLSVFKEQIKNLTKPKFIHFISENWIKSICFLKGTYWNLQKYFFKQGLSVLGQINSLVFS